MAEMTPFRYGGYYDVPRCLSLHYRGQWLLLQSAFDENLDEYPDEYSVYVMPDLADDSQPIYTPEFLKNTSMVCIGKIAVNQVTFDPSMRKELDASILDHLLDQ